MLEQRFSVWKSLWNWCQLKRKNTRKTQVSFIAFGFENFFIDSKRQPKSKIA